MLASCRLLRPQPHVLDARALAALRVLLALFVLFDLRTRYGDGGISLAWYTSINDGDAAILGLNDSPHGHPLHKLWFYRGSARLQRALFASLAATCFAFLLGIGCGQLGFTTIALYVQVTALHGRCEAVNDGSDRFLRSVLLWCVLLPLDRRGALGAGLRSSRDRRVRPRDDLCVRGWAPFGLTWQLVAMYWGTAAHRSSGRMWWPPHLSAVHYVLVSNFATREWPRRWLESSPLLGQMATAGAMIVEVLMPLMLLLTPCEGGGSFGGAIGSRAVPCAVLAAFHLALLASMRLISWQLIGILVMSAWMPSQLIDEMHRRLFRHVPIAALGPPAPLPRPRVPRDDHDATTSRRGAIARALAIALLAYLNMLWCGERGWLVKPDGGNVGEALRIGQNWIMFGPEPPVECFTWSIRAAVARAPGEGVTGEGVAGGATIDVLAALRTNRWHGERIESTDVLGAPEAETAGQSYPFVNHRWERAFHVWASAGRSDPRRLEARLRRLGLALCAEGTRRRRAAGHAPLQSVEMSLQVVFLEPRVEWRQYQPWAGANSKVECSGQREVRGEGES